MNPIVTIISPYYMRSYAVDITIKSIQNQTFKEFEAIIIDDCSPDDTWETLLKTSVEINDERFKFIRNEINLGFTKTLNKAISMSKGQYIAIVGSGDFCSPERIQTQIETLKHNKHAVFCTTDSITIDPISGKTFQDHTYNKKTICYDDIVGSVPFTHGSIMYRKETLDLVGGYETVFQWCSDWDLFFRLLKHGDAIYIPKALYTRYAQPDGASYHPEKSLSQIQHKYLAHLLSHASTNSERKKIISNAHISLSETVTVYKENIIRDLWKREIKLIFMKRFNDAKSLQNNVEKKYGISLKNRLGSKIAIFISYMPINMTILINFSRNIAKILEKRFNAKK